MPGPLAGIKVVELTAIGPVPFAGAWMADMGADVVHIDRPPGTDPTRSDPSSDFYNRNKRSVALDLKQPAAGQALLALVERADILLEGYRPGVAERLGLGPETCHARNPRLVYARMTGWGQQGPMAQEAGHDINYLALTGALHCIGPGDGPPSPPLNLVADLGGGAMYLAAGVLAAVLEARQSGQGQVLDVAMVDGVAHLMSAFQSFRQVGEWTARRQENIVDGGAPYYGAYTAQDGKCVAVGAIEPHFYANLLSVMGLDPATLPDQNDRSRWPSMRARFAEVFRGRTREEWVAAARGRDACLSPVLDIDEAAQHPQMSERRVFQRFDGMVHPSPAPRLARTPASLHRPTPRPGEHNAEVLAEWGVPPAVREAVARS